MWYRHKNYNTTVVATAAAVVVVVAVPIRIVRSVREEYIRGREFGNSRSCVVLLDVYGIHAVNTVVNTF